MLDLQLQLRNRATSNNVNTIKICRCIGGRIPSEFCEIGASDTLDIVARYLICMRLRWNASGKARWLYYLRYL